MQGSKPYSTETFFRVYDNDEGTYLTIRPSPDFPDHNVLLTTEGQENVDYFGNLWIDLPRDMMMQVGKALIDMAKSLGG